jgi:hypothetical protein
MNARDRFLKSQRRQRMEFERSIADEILERPDRSYAAIGQRFGLKASRVAQLAVKFRIRRKRGPKVRNG